MTDFYTYENLDLLKKRLGVSSSFYLIYSVGSKDDKYLKKIAQECATDASCLGVDFCIEKEEHFFDDLFFLRGIVREFLDLDKKVGLWGIPRCVCRRLLGGYYFMKFLCFEIGENNPEGVPEGGAQFIEACDECRDKDTCIGLGQKNILNYKPSVKKKVPKSNNEIPSRRFKSGSLFLAEKHDVFVQHCRKIDSPATYRTVYYAENINFYSPHSYKNRFIYGCDYLMPEEYQQEFEFLRGNVLNPLYVELLKSIADVNKTSQIAYSLAEKGGMFRESFYMFVARNYSTGLLCDFGINYQIPMSRDMNFFGAGVDVIEGRSEFSKLYFQSSKNFVNSYFENYNIDVSRLGHNFHYVVIRLDRNCRFLSYKIELLFTYDELPIFEPILPHYEFYVERLTHEGIYNFAVEFEQDRISKINIYHREVLLDRAWRVST